MLGLVILARDIEARVIFHGDTKQLQAVGRGQPLGMLEKELAFGMHVGRIDVTRRQLKIEDKQLSRELSSGAAPRFCTAMKKLIERGAISRGEIGDAVQGILANRNAAQPVETIVLSSTHRLAEKVSEKLHEAYKKTRPEMPMAQVAALKPKELQPVELLSTANYKPEDLHVAFTRHRANARMFVQDISVLRQVANRSLIKDLTARDLEARRIVTIVERIEEALSRAVRMGQGMTNVATREHKRIRELFLRKRRRQVREQHRGFKMAVQGKSLA
jgi:AAA domain-containing protein